MKEEPGRKPASRGFSLIEVLVAVSLVGFTFIGILGLLAVGATNNQVSTQQSVATTIAESIIADLRSTPAYSSTGKSVRFLLTLPTNTPSTTPPAAPFSGVVPSYLYFDNSPSFLPLGASKVYSAPQSPVPSGAIYVAAVYLYRIATAGPTSTLVTGSQTSALIQSNDIVRVVVTWPAQTTTVPAGNVDVVSQFLIE